MLRISRIVVISAAKAWRSNLFGGTIANRGDSVLISFGAARTESHVVRNAKTALLMIVGGVKVV